MSEEQSIFNGTNTTAPVTPVVAAPITPNLPPEVLEFVGTGKKYASVDDAIKSVPHAQKHIATIEAELEAARKELEKRRTTEDLLEELRKTNNVQTEPTSHSKTLSQEEIEQMVQRTIGQNAAQQQAANNTESVKATFISKFGDVAEKEYIRIAQEAGMSVQDLNRLSATSPNAVLKLAGIASTKTDVLPAKPNSSINTEALNNTNTNQNLSAKVKPGASTKDLLASWKIAGQKVGKQY